MANCPSCGGLMQFNIKKQKIECRHCASFYDPYEIDRVNEAECSQDEFGVNVFVCPQCGGELMSSAHDLSGNCSFCGSPVVFEVKMRNEKRPEYIIPFQLTKEDCKKKYMEEIGKRLFVPKELKDPEFIEGFRGIYVPYWMYNVNLQGEPFQVQAKHRYTSGKYDYVDTYGLFTRNDNS